jgi:TRAP-type uncharacterized transport system substrate-binding protein
MKLLSLYRRRWWLFYLPILGFTAVAVAWAAVRWYPMPPTRLVIAAGTQQGSYAQLAQRYAQRLDPLGIQVEIDYDDSQQGAIDRLLAPGRPATQAVPASARAADIAQASIGFAHGLDASPTTPLQTLAITGREPVWIFVRIDGPASVPQLAGHRIAAGMLRSSTHAAALLMLEQAGLKPSDVTFVPLQPLEAVQALADKAVDAVFQAANEEAESIQLLIQNPALRLLGYDEAAQLAARNPRLQPLLLPQGVIELRGNIPPGDLTLMSLQTHLLVRPEVHPALQRAVLAVATEIHAEASFLQRSGEYPNVRNAAFALSPTARAYHAGERPWLEAVLPYGLAQQAALLLFAVLPLLALAALLVDWIPKLFDWRISAVLNHFYGELKFLEREIDQAAIDQPITLKALLDRLDSIERQVVRLDLPDAFSERWYTLREHIAAARERLLTLRAR